MCPQAPRTISYRKHKRPENRPNAYQRGYNDRWRARTAQWIQEQAQQGNCRCAYCKVPLTGRRRDIHVDHVVPHNGNQELFWDENNWAMSCPSCNSAKGNRIA